MVDFAANGFVNGIKPVVKIKIGSSSKKGLACYPRAFAKLEKRSRYKSY